LDEIELVCENERSEVKTFVGISEDVVAAWYRDKRLP